MLWLKSISLLKYMHHLQMNLLTKQKETHRLREQTYGSRKGAGVKGKE